jgi:hypothetical protein
MRPALKPGLQWVWRDRDTLQVGIDPRRAIALTGMRAAAAVLGLLDGSRDRGQVIAAAAARGIAAEAADRVIALLTAAGTVCDFPASTIAALPDDSRARLAGELATACLAHGDADGGARVLARRQAAAIRVHGTGQVGSGTASLLTASGVGRVISVGPAQDCTAPMPARHSVPLPDLAVLAGPHRPELASMLVRAGVPHLAAAAGEAIGVVGPMVVPGKSACLRCLDLARTDRDPAWPLILAQLAGTGPKPPACGAALAAAVAAHAASQALAFIDRVAPPAAVVNGTLELVLPDWQWRRRTWLPHQKCSCTRHGASCRRM